MSPPARTARALGVALVLATAAPALFVGVELASFVAERRGAIVRVEAAVGPVCHHRPERTPNVGGRALPVCARCSGLYLGAATGGALAFVWGSGRRLAGLLVGVAASGLVAGGAALLEALGAFATGNGLRVALGVPLGLAPTWIAGLGARLLLDEAGRDHSSSVTSGGASKSKR